MEPAHLYQSSGGEPPENRRWCVHRLKQHVKVGRHGCFPFIWGLLNLHRWEEPAPVGFAQVHR